MRKKTKLVIPTISNVDIAKSAAVLNICCDCKKEFLQCDERIECGTFYDNYKTSMIAIDMYEKLKCK